MATFSVVLLTAPPVGQTAEAAGPFIKIDGREALLRSIELFLNRDNVKQIQLVIADQHLEESKRRHGAHLGFSGVKLTAGGPKWMDQIAAAAEKLSPEATHVLVHDAARPAVPYSDIDAVLEAAEKHATVSLSAPVRSTLVETDEGGNAIAIHSPDRFLQLLTPRAYSRDRFLRMAQTKQEPHAAECTLVTGSPLNVRLGHGGEASLVKAMINLLPKPRLKPPSSPFEEAQW